MFLSLGRKMVSAIAMLFLFTVIASPALADHKGGHNGGDDNGGQIGGDDNGGRSGGDDNGGHPHAPEIDPGSAISAITLLTGGILLLVQRRRTKK
jgi:hypothetical protein